MADDARLTRVMLLPVMSAVCVDPTKARFMIEALISQGIDGKKGYLEMAAERPREWPKAPSLEYIMALPNPSRKPEP